MNNGEKQVLILSGEKNDDFLDKAEKLKTEFIKDKKHPKSIVKVKSDPSCFQGWKVEKTGSIDILTQKSFAKGDKITLDFGTHQVGYLNLSIKTAGSPPDAPFRFKLTFGEMPCEIGEDFADYEGWLSSSWLQEEVITLDILPTEITLPRRYAFRYLQIEIIDTSTKYDVVFDEISCTTVSTADQSKVEKLPADVPENLKEIDRVANLTLKNCMQSVFEDGPKRDRRLWLGDLRLQALANYYTFENYDLVKRCLYLFAGVPLENGQVAANIFMEPEPLADDTMLYDYSLFFAVTLFDYYQHSDDYEALKELWPTAKKQIEFGLARLNEKNIVQDSNHWWSFVDWTEGLNKQASAHAILIYTLKRGIKLARELGEEKLADYYREQSDLTSQAALTYLWDEKKELFISGDEKQISWASQIWMVLAGVLDAETGNKLLKKIMKNKEALKITTPYMYHHLVEAFIKSGNKEKGLEILNYYWGSMIEDGADCFWELYDPEDKSFSPYGSNIINSYCHAWSCTPSYFIRKYYMNEEV